MSSDEKLFHSKTDPIPPVRGNINIFPIDNNGDSYLYFHDQLGYAPPDFALDRRIGPLLSLLDGQKSVNDLTAYLAGEVSGDQLLDYVRFLDKNRLLHSGFFRTYAEQVESEYESSDVHTSVTAGTSFPSNPEELRSYLDTLFSPYLERDQETNRPVKALYAPHIDPRVSSESYARAFAPLRKAKPKRVIILATSHYASLYPDTYDNSPFIVTDKTFQMPLEDVRVEEDAIRELSRMDDAGITIRDRAHRLEHSIELHLLFTSYLWDHEYEIVPILVKGFDDLYYMRDGHLGQQVDRFGGYLNDRYADDDETLFLISGDLAHVGKKFGDSQPARQMFQEIKSFDRLFLDYAEAGDRESLLSLVGDKYDPYRTCGFAPLYTFLSACPGLEGKTLHYDIWDESERESAVSFGSVLYSRD